MPLSEFPLPPRTQRATSRPRSASRRPGPCRAARSARLEQVECPRSAPGATRARRRAARRCCRSCYASGKGSNVYDVDGNRYVDLAAGFGALLSGTRRRRVARAVEAQAQRLWMALGDVYSADAKIALLERLAALHPGVRRARDARAERAATRSLPRSRRRALATGKPGHRRLRGRVPRPRLRPARGVRAARRATATPFAEQLNPHVTFAPYARSARRRRSRALARSRRRSRTGTWARCSSSRCSGRGGVRRAAGRVPDRRSARLAHRPARWSIADEIWTGLGRTGAMVRVDRGRARPPTSCASARGSAAACPISACVARRRVMQRWAARTARSIHTSTHPARRSRAPRRSPRSTRSRFRKLVVRAPRSAQRAASAFRSALAGAAAWSRCAARPDDRRSSSTAATARLARHARPARARLHRPHRRHARRGAHAHAARSTSTRSASPTPRRPCATCSARLTVMLGRRVLLPPRATPSTPRVRAFIAGLGAAADPPSRSTRSPSTIARFQAARVPGVRAPRAARAASTRTRATRAARSRPCRPTSSGSRASRRTRPTATSRSSAPAAPRRATPRAASTRCAPPRRTSWRRSRWGAALLWPRSRATPRARARAPARRAAATRRSASCSSASPQRSRAAAAFHVHRRGAARPRSIRIGVVRAGAAARAAGQPVLVLATSFALVHLLDAPASARQLDLRLPPRQPCDADRRLQGQIARGRRPTSCARRCRGAFAVARGARGRRVRDDRALEPALRGTLAAPSGRRGRTACTSRRRGCA